MESPTIRDTLCDDAIDLSGATETVTGSKFLLEAAGKRILIDCGLFQGSQGASPAETGLPRRSIHDRSMPSCSRMHTSITPVIFRVSSVRDFAAPFTAHRPRSICFAFCCPIRRNLQEEEANFRNKHRRSKHDPALPLYTVEDADAAHRLTKTVTYRTLYRSRPA
jgi:metallo-beta-lactamase family protein